MLDWSDAAQQQLAGGVLSAAVFLRIATSPDPIRVWSGDGDFAYGAADLVETAAGATYTGLGLLAASLPAVNQLINGEAARVEFTISGAAVTPEVASLASASAGQIRQVSVNLGFLILDEDLQPMSPTAWLWQGLADSLKISRSGRGDTQTRTLTLSCGSRLTGRRRATPLYWTDPDQRARSSTDRFCERVSEYNEGSTVVWPPST